MSRESRGSLRAPSRVTSLVTVLIYGLGLGTPTLSLAGEAAAPAEGGLSIITDPAGASVYVNGESKGVTPLRVGAVAAGDHRVTVVKEGYLENSRVVSVEAGRIRELEVRLTSSDGAAGHAAQITPGGEGGGVPAWVWIAAGAGGGIAAYLLLRDTNEPPNCGSVSINPSTGLQAAQSFAISSQGASDPDQDALTFTWEFGDGTTGSGQSVTKVYNNTGNFTVTVTCSDGKESTTATGTATVRGMSGNWRGNITGFGPFTMSLTQSGTSVTGSYSDSDGPGTLTGNVSSPNGVSFTVRQPQIGAVFTFTGRTSGDVNSVTGTTFGGRTFTMSRQ